MLYYDGVEKVGTIYFDGVPIRKEAMEMGMFDLLRCDYPLPDLPDSRLQMWSFQIKDFECQMNHYLITRDGSLREELPKSRFLKITRAIRFYTTYADDSSWLEYHAIFERGRLKSIVREKE